MTVQRLTDSTPSAPDARPLQGAAWLPHGYRLDSHSHAEGQLVYAASGALATATVSYGRLYLLGDAAHIVPPMSANATFRGSDSPHTPLVKSCTSTRLRWDACRIR
ncbi:hypothetical protein GCM10010246_32180 [Streptomyces cuspidosporus]|uniref:FAD-binding domain-containing protein n=1 Tax=Streptomyces cuspidosporus TaxID=66882 RepID=A0ABP5T2D3_9ACTN